MFGAGMLAPPVYVLLLAGSSLMTAWGTAGQYTMLSEVGGPEGRLAVNALASAQVSFATIVGPLVAGLLLGWVSPSLLIAFDAASFGVLGIVAWTTDVPTEAGEQPIDARAESGFRLLRRPDLLSLTLVTRNTRRITLLIVAGWGAAANLPFVLAARSAVVMISTPLGTAIGGPLVGSLGASGTLALSGLATVLLAVVAGVLWTGARADAPTLAT
jgi:MFS family permease